jgi:hypothetical protein
LPSRPSLLNRKGWLVRVEIANDDGKGERGKEELYVKRTGTRTRNDTVYGKHTECKGELKRQQLIIATMVIKTKMEWNKPEESEDNRGIENDEENN